MTEPKSVREIIEKVYWEGRRSAGMFPDPMILNKALAAIRTLLASKMPEREDVSGYTEGHGLGSHSHAIDCSYNAALDAVEKGWEEILN